MLIAIRLHVRPVIAFGAALCLAFTGTIWEEATFSEMNGLHLFLAALLIHRALVWRDERRDRDLVIGGAARRPVRVEPRPGHHGRADRHPVRPGRRPPRDPRRARSSSCRPAPRSSIGLLPYLYLPLRAMAGPSDLYGRFLYWDGFFAHVSGAQFRSDMHFLSVDSLRAAVAAMPQVIDHLVDDLQRRLRPAGRRRDRRC